MSSKPRLNILFLSRWFPYPPHNGSKLRIYNLLLGLANVHNITLITFAEASDLASEAETMSALNSLCEAVHTVPYRPYNPTSARAMAGLFTPVPRSVIDTHVPEMDACIQRVIGEKDYDLVIATERDMMAYCQDLGALPVILEDIEIGYFHNQKTEAPSRLQRLRHQLTYLKMRNYMQRVTANAAACTVVSIQEAALLEGVVPKAMPVELIPNGVSVAAYEDVERRPQPDTLIFTGSFRYAPNYQAMVWFLEEVYPLIQVEVPAVQLTITGDHADLPLPSAQNVIQTGFVDDIRPLVASSWCSIVPIFQGSGTRLKILEAMAMGVPVVASTKGAEGLELEDEKHLLIADQPEAFAKAVVKLLKSPQLRQEISANGYELICNQYDWSVIMPKFLALTEQVTYA